MNKEEILSLLKTQVLNLRDRSAEIQKDPQLMADWIAKTKLLQQRVNSLNSCDILWINDEYSKWAIKEIKPYTDSLDPETLKRFNS